MKTSEVLERALALIPDEQHWIKFAAHDDRDRFCLAGAIWHAWGLQEHATVLGADRVVRQMSGHYTLSGFNDAPTTTYADVRRVLEQAIAHAQAEEASRDV